MSKNDITGDTIKTKPQSDEFDKGWDRIFGPKKCPTTITEFCPPPNPVNIVDNRPISAAKHNYIRTEPISGCDFDCTSEITTDERGIFSKKTASINTRSEIDAFLGFTFIKNKELLSDNHWYLVTKPECINFNSTDTCGNMELTHVPNSHYFQNKFLDQNKWSIVDNETGFEVKKS